MCPEQARAVYVEGIEKDPTDSMVCGTALHAGIEYLLHQKRAGVLDIENDIAIAHSVIENELSTLTWVKTKWPETTVYMLARQALDKFIASTLEHVDPMLIEHRFEHVFHEDDERVITMTGTIDCVTADKTIIDWKTAGRDYQRWEKQRWAVQPTVYCWAMAQEYGEMFPFQYAIYVHGQPAVQMIGVERNEGHVEWLRAQCVQIARQLETNAEGPWALQDAGWWCGPKWCPKFDSCKGEHVAI